MDSECALGECACKGGCFRLDAMGDKTGMLEACERKAEKEGTDICAKELCFLTGCWIGACEEGLLCGAAGGGGTEPFVSEEDAECE